jgi:hypothetical protein
MANKLLENSKDLITIAIQLGLLFATYVLIKVGQKQAKAADAQAQAADRQAMAAEAQVAVAHAQVSEMLSQGTAARRPFFKIKSLDPIHFKGAAILCNVGQGIALRTTWRFANPGPGQWIYELGAVAVGMEINMPWKTT